MSPDSASQCRHKPSAIPDRDSGLVKHCKYGLKKSLTFIPVSLSSAAYGCCLLPSTIIDTDNHFELKRKSESYGIYSHWLNFAIIILVFSPTIKSDPIHRIPHHQDIEAAFESTKCAIREEIVDIRKIHPTLPSDATFMPSCVLLQKCSGCCQSDHLECMPTSIYSTNIDISQQLRISNKFSYITLNFTHHADCACQSPLNPTCIPRICKQSEVWNKEQCRCDPRCAPQECGHRQRWDPKTCRCRCIPCHPDRIVHSRFSQDEFTCICQCKNAHRGRSMCKQRARYSVSRCACVSRRIRHRGSNRS